MQLSSKGQAVGQETWNKFIIIFITHTQLNSGVL